MRITSKGQVTIPLAVRERAGLMPGTDIDFTVRGADVILTKGKKRGKRVSRGDAIVARLRGRATIKMTTEEIMALMRGPRR